MILQTAMSVVAILIAAASLVGATIAIMEMRRWRFRCESLEASFASLAREVEHVASISVRTGRQVKRIENDFSGVADRVDVVESRGASQSLDQAIDWAKRGADSARLTRDLGLSPGEAELIARMHGRKRSA